MSEADTQTQPKEEIPPLDTQAIQSPKLNSNSQIQQLNTHHEENAELISLFNFNPSIKAKRFLTR